METRLSLEFAAQISTFLLVYIYYLLQKISPSLKERSLPIIFYVDPHPAEPSHSNASSLHISCAPNYLKDFSRVQMARSSVKEVWRKKGDEKGRPPLYIYIPGYCPLSLPPLFQFFSRFFFFSLRAIFATCTPGKS